MKIKNDRLGTQFWHRTFSQIPEAKDVTGQDNGPLSFDDFAKEIAKIGNQEVSSGIISFTYMQTEGLSQWI